jgi:hypothetical protein
MNVRELAESDLRYTLENLNGSGVEFTLIDPAGTAYTITGAVGDIGILYESTGEAVRNRSIVCVCRMRSLSALTQETPERGWRAVVSDLQGRTVKLFVTGNDPDRTLGVYRLTMGLDLEE